MMRKQKSIVGEVTFKNKIFINQKVNKFFHQEEFLLFFKIGLLKM